MRLFGGWLDCTAKLQHEKYGVYPEQLEGSAYAEYLRLNGFAALVELGEFAQKRNWKPYKIQGRDETRRDEAIEELVDVLHHIANILILEGVDDKELSERYLDKVNKNRARSDHHAHT
jgi:hypothetical protein